MHAFGFSTGALALGDFEKGLRLLVTEEADAVELSALRDHELPGLIERIDSLDLDRYRYVSVHAPSRFSRLPEGECARLLSRCADLGWHVILHPDAIQEPGHWDGFGSMLCIENMDKRKSEGRTVEELNRCFKRFPDASFCLDLGHAQQVDPSMALTRGLIREYRDRIVQIHLSELNAQSQHEPLSMGMVHSVLGIADHLQGLAVILESRVEEAAIGEELEMARMAFGAAIESVTP